MSRAWHSIDSLRVDGDYSADPRDYPDRSADEPVGRELHGFLTTHVDGQSWPSEVATLLALNPTRADLEHWSSVHRLKSNCGHLLPAMGSAAVSSPSHHARAGRPGSGTSGTWVHLVAEHDSDDRLQRLMDDLSGTPRVDLDLLMRQHG